MSGPITFEFVGTLFAVLMAAGWMWRMFSRKFEELQRELRAAVLALQTEQAAHRLQVTREYASVQHLEKVETRLISAIDRLIEEVRGLREAVVEVRSKKP